MREQIIERIKSLGGSGISFVDLEKIEGFSGDWSMEFPNTNIIIWPEISKEASDIIRDLCIEKIIEMIPCQSLIYIVDGRIPKLKIARALRKYKEPRWIPMIINLKSKLSN